MLFTWSAVTLSCFATFKPLTDLLAALPSENETVIDARRSPPLTFVQDRVVVEMPWISVVEEEAGSPKIAFTSSSVEPPSPLFIISPTLILS